MEELVEQRLNALLAEPVEKLRLLPEFSQQEVVLDGKKIALATYREILENGSHRIVVQARRERWGGIVAGVVVGGYELSDTGSPRKLRANELYDFT
jgi:hypothetical protein